MLAMVAATDSASTVRKKYSILYIGHSIIAGHFTSLTYTQLCFINIKTIFFVFRDVYLYLIIALHNTGYFYDNFGN